MAAIPIPEAGLVIGYSYLWRREHQTGQDEGLKDRPSVIVLATGRAADGATIVTVLPITHSAPTHPGRRRRDPGAGKAPPGPGRRAVLDRGD